MPNQEFINAQFDRLDKWEARHLKHIEQELREKFIVDGKGVTIVTYRPEGEFESLYRLHHLAMKISLLWESRYFDSLSADSLDFTAVSYVHVVIDQRLGLRKTLSFRDAKYLPTWARCRIREQVDGIIAALDDIEDLTK